MPNYKMAKPGHHFAEEGVNIAWGLGRAASDVVSVPIARQSPRFKQRVLAGVIVETKDPLTTVTGTDDVREYRLLTGDEARAVKAEPPGPVTRSMYNPVTGELMQVEVGLPRVVAEAVAAENPSPQEPVAEEIPADEAEDEPAEPGDPAELENEEAPAQT